jgi:GGDEF domain-containing protein
MPVLALTTATTAASPAASLPQRLLQALEQADALVALYDAADALLWASPAFHATFGGAGLPAAPRPVRNAEATRRLEHRLPDGRRLWTSETTQPDGGVLWMAVDVSALAAFAAPSGYADLPDEGGTPPRMWELAAAAVQEARRKNRFLSVALLAVDAAGEAEAEAGLRHVVAHGQRQLRPGDRLGRLDDGQLLLVLPGAALHAASLIVQRVRQALPPLALPGRPAARLRLCVGLAQLDDGEDLPLLQRRADRALAQARQRGDTTVLDRG